MKTKSFTPTDKQMALMSAIEKGDGNGENADLDQILESLSYRTTKQSLQFSIRALIRHGAIERMPLEKRERNGKRYIRRPIALTQHGQKILAKFRRVSCPKITQDIDFIEEMSSSDE